MPHSRILSEVVVHGLSYNQAWLEADEATLYVKFILEGEKASTTPSKALPGASVEWPGDLIFEQEHYLTSDLRIKLFHKHATEADSLVAEGKLTWEAVLSRKVVEVALSSKAGNNGTICFAVGSRYLAGPRNSLPGGDNRFQTTSYLGLVDGHPAGYGASADLVRSRVSLQGRPSHTSSGGMMQVLSYPFQHCRCTGLVRRSVQGVWHGASGIMRKGKAGLSKSGQTVNSNQG